MSNLDFALFYPLVVLGLVYTVLTVAGRIIEGRGRGELGETLQTLGFGAILLAAPYALLLLIISLINYPVRLSDMALVFGIVFAFFALLLGLLLVLSEVRVGGRALGTYLGTLLAAGLAVLVVLAIL